MVADSACRWIDKGHPRQLLAGADATVRVFTLHAGGNEGLAILAAA
jgi:hypothetical protein